MTRLAHGVDFRVFNPCIIRDGGYCPHISQYYITSFWFSVVGKKACTAVADPGGGSGVVGVITPPPLVAENVVCSNSNFSPTGAITPPPPSPLAVPPGHHSPFRKSCIRACTAMHGGIWHLFELQLVTFCSISSSS